MKCARTIQAKCKKCGTQFAIDMGDLTTPEQVMEALKKMEFTNCPGHHEEITSPATFWELIPDSIQEKMIPNEQEWVQQTEEKMRTKLISSDEVREAYEITGFSMGIAVGYRKSDREKVYLNHADSPEGHRFYWEM